MNHHQALVRRAMRLQIAEVPTEPPDAGGLRIALSHVGVCGTDLQILNGSRPDTADILGHEGVGVVVEAGPEAALQVGEKVVFNPVAQLSCDRILGHNVAGVFQEQFTVDAQAVEQGLVLRAEPGLPPQSAVLTEPLGAIIYGHELMARVVSCLRNVLIFGAGPIGLLAAAYFRALGARVTLVHPHQERLDTARALRLLEGICATTTAPCIAHNTERFDVALICTTRSGAPKALQQAIDAVRHEGCIDLLTNYPESEPAPYGLSTAALRATRGQNVCGQPREGRYLTAEISGRRIAFTGHRGTSAAHLIRAMKVLRSQPLPYTNSVTHVLSLREAAEAIPLLASSQSRTLYGRDCIKAVINMAG